jgi:DNA-binding CsgD family transcriptional regulator
MLPDQQELSVLLGSLYDAASDANLWAPFLAQLSSMTHAQSALFLMHHAGQDVYTISRSWEVEPSAIKLYGEHYHAQDVWAQRGLSKPAGSVCTSEELCSRREIESAEIYNDFMLRFGTEYGMFGVLEKSESRWASVSLFRDGSNGEFQPEELEILQFLSPHMRRAFKLHFQFSELKSSAAGADAALDMLATGVILLSAGGQVVRMNRSAAATVAERDGLLATREGLRAEHQGESALLVKTVGDAAGTLQGGTLSAGGTVRISRRSRPSLQITLCPTRAIATDMVGTVSAAAFVVDPLRHGRTTNEALRVLFGLSPAECRVALLLGDGHAPKEIAGMIGVTLDTVRSQIKSIFGKTGVSRQSDLVRLLMSHAGLGILAK